MVVIDVAVLERLGNYTKPVKTKHLAPRLGLSRPGLVKILNRLAKRGLIKWHVPKRNDEKQTYGWIKL